MVEPAWDHPTGLQHLLDEAAELRDRLRRITVALSLIEDMVAEALERVVVQNEAAAPDHGAVAALRSQAHRARATAQECRQFARHLDDLHGPG